MAKLVAKTYAQALFEVGTETNKLDQFGEEVAFVLDAFNAYPQFYQLYDTPNISNDEKKDMLKKVFESKISEEVMNFLKILIDKRRAGVFKDAVAEYQKSLNAHHNVQNAVAITAVPLNDQDKTNLEKTLSEKTGKTIILTNEVDPSVVGGVMIKMGDKVMDGTIKTRLEKMQKTLSQIIV